jgi:hypothetical protein
VETLVTGGNSYRSIVTSIKVHRRRLNAAFGPSTEKCSLDSSRLTA